MSLPLSPYPYHPVLINLHLSTCPYQPAASTYPLSACSYMHPLISYSLSAGPYQHSNIIYSLSTCPYQLALISLLSPVSYKKAADPRCDPAGGCRWFPAAHWLIAQLKWGLKGPPTPPTRVRFHYMYCTYQSY